MALLNSKLLLQTMPQRQLEMKMKLTTVHVVLKGLLGANNYFSNRLYRINISA